MGCFKGTLFLQIKVSTKLYQALTRDMAYPLQDPFKNELKWLQEQQIIVSLGVSETSHWCKSFVVVPKPGGTVCLCLDPARLNQVLIRPVNRGSAVNDIFPKQTNVYYLTLIDASSG